MCIILVKVETVKCIVFNITLNIGEEYYVGDYYITRNLHEYMRFISIYNKLRFPCYYCLTRFCN